MNESSYLLDCWIVFLLGINIKGKGACLPDQNVDELGSHQSSFHKNKKLRKLKISFSSFERSIRE
jgi:hypothetical protein